MSNFKLLGLLSWFGAAILVGFQGIARLMETDRDFMGQTLENAMDGKLLEFADEISIHVLRSAALFILDTPLYMLLLVFGGICLLLSKIFSKD